MANFNSSNEEDAESNISETMVNTSRLNNKVTKTYIISIVHNYFCIFHSWLPSNRDIKGKFIFKLIRLLFWSTLIYFLLFILNNATKVFIEFDFTLFFLISVVISWLFQIVALSIGFLLLSPKKIETIQDRMKSELNIDTSHLTNLKSKNFFIARFELEKIWLKNIVTDNNIEDLIEKVESSINNRKPSSRDIDSIIQLMLSNQYIINLLLVILTVTLTVSLPPLIPSITDENFFSMLRMLNLSALYFWIALVLLFIFIKILFIVFIWSIEITTKNKIFVTWRYEIFRDMLARHQTVIIKKPRRRYVPILHNDKTQARIESESKGKVMIDIVEKIDVKI